MKYSDLALRTFLFAICLIALGWGYQLMFLDHAPTAFRSIEEDMSYAWYVPIFSLYVVYHERNAIFKSLGEASVWGFILLIPSFFLGFLGIRGHQLRLEEVGFVGMVLALTWTFFGLKTMRQVMFPALFLLFCMPFTSFLDVITVHLRLIATGTAYTILQGFGADVIRQGTMLGAADGSFAIDVAAPCSGLRSLFAMMALTAGYAYFNQPTWLRRGILFALSVPIAVLGNVMRILTITLVGTYCSSEFATGFYHDYSGYVVFIFAIILMLAASALITEGAKRCANS